MNAHTKPQTIATTDGMFRLDTKTGHYRPAVDEEHYSPLVTTLVWSLFYAVGLLVIGAGYLAFAALAS